jgi:hypothetical protein
MLVRTRRRLYHDRPSRTPDSCSLRMGRHGLHAPCMTDMTPMGSASRETS